MSKIYFEDFTLHEHCRLGPYIIEEKEIIDFAKQWDPLPFHIDPQLAETTSIGAIIASGFQLLAITQKLFIEQRPTAWLIGLGLDEVRFLAPVRPKDTLVLEFETISKRSSKSRPEGGIVTNAFTLLNQRDEAVLTYKGSGMVEKRNRV
jgi:acyl dehydratase